MPLPSDNELPPTFEPHSDPGPEIRSPGESTDQVVSGLRALSNSSPPPNSSVLADWGAEIDRQNRRSAVYDDLYEIVQPCFRAYEDWIAEAIYSAWYEGRGRLLVVGCGTGTLLQRLAQRMSARLITALDVSPRMAQAAREKVPAVPEIRTQAFDSYRPVIPFDVVAFNGSLAAMPDLRAVVNHTAGMTLHGSRIVICVRNGDWLWQDPALRRQACLRHPSWYWKRWINGSRIAEVSQMTESLISPHKLLTAGRISEAFVGRFGLRDERTAFGVTRLFEDVIAVPREQGLQTVGQTREQRPWMRSVGRLRKLDDAFAGQHPMAGGLLAMLFDKLH